MKNIQTSDCIFSRLIVVPTYHASAGNKDDQGKAGASELLINPWARSTGWGLLVPPAPRASRQCILILPGLPLLKEPK